MVLELLDWQLWNAREMNERRENSLSNLMFSGFENFDERKKLNSKTN
jgi:hypothetical protein